MTTKQHLILTRRQQEKLRDLQRLADRRRKAIERMVTA